MKHINAFGNEYKYFNNTKNDIYIASELILKLNSLYDVRTIDMMLSILKKPRTTKELMEHTNQSFDLVSKTCKQFPELFKFKSGRWHCNIMDIMDKYAIYPKI